MEKEKEENYIQGYKDSKKDLLEKLIKEYPDKKTHFGLYLMSLREQIYN